MSFFHNLNKTLASIAGKDSEAKTQATESVQQSELKTILESSYSAKAAAAGKDIGKPGKQFSKIAKSAGERYGSKAAGERVAGAVLNKLRNKTEEGNEFSGELAQAKAQHKDSFEVDGKTYPVKESATRELTDADNKVLAMVKKEIREMKQALTTASSEDSRYYKDRLNDLRGMVRMIHGEEPFGLDTDVMDEVSDMYRSIGASMYESDPKDKITFADKIAGAKKEVDEMLGDVAADAMRNAIGKIREIENDEVDEGAFKNMGIEVQEALLDFAEEIQKGMHSYDDVVDELNDMFGKVKASQDPAAIEAFKLLRTLNPEDFGPGEGGGPNRSAYVSQDAMDAINGYGDVDEGWDDMKKDVKKRMADMSKMKPGEKMAGHKHDIEKTATGIKATRRTDADGISVGADEKDSDGEKRGRGRPKGTGVKMGAKGPTGKSKLMTRENDDGEYDDEYDDEAGMAKQDLSQAKDAAEELRSILASDENLPEWVQAKITKAVDYLDTARDYVKSEKHGEKELEEKKDVKRDNKAEKAGKKVTKDIEYDEKEEDGIHGDKRDAEDDKAEKAGKKVAKDIEHDEKEDKPKKSKGGIKFGEGVYEALDSQLESLINESMNVDLHIGQGPAGEPEESMTVTATGDDAKSLAQILRNAGMGGGSSCSVCGESECGCSEMVDENSPDWPTNQETSDDALQYAGGLNKPKSTGQTTTPVIASQLSRQVSMEESVKLERKLFDLYKDFTK